MFAGLHRGAEAYEQAVEDCRAEARLLSALGARHLVLLPEQHTDMHSGDALEPGELEPAQWNDLVTGMSALGKVLQEEYGVSLVFHPHADSHVDTQARVERFLQRHRPADRVALPRHRAHLLLRRRQPRDHPRLPRPDRLRPPQAGRPRGRPRAVHAEQLSFAEAVKLGAMVEPPTGIPAMEPLLEALGRLDADLFAIVEQDMYPCEPDYPLPVATRTRTYLNGCGLGPAPRRR